MLSAELKRVEGELKGLERVCSVLGIVAQKSLLDVITEAEKPVLKDKTVLKEKPKGCHGACRNFSKADYGTGSCKLDKNPVVPTERGCKDWKSTGDDRLLAEAVRAKAKRLAGLRG